MIFLVNRSGQMCNRLRFLSAFVALGIEYKQKMTCPVIEDDITQYINLQSDKRDLKIYYSSLWSCLSRPMGILYNLIRNKNQYFDKNKGDMHLQIFTECLSFTEPTLLYKHYEELKDIFAFKQEVVVECENIFSRIEIKNKTVVAVHFRKGDYKIWHDGRWYFENEEFIVQMQAINMELDEAVFLVFSNEILTEEVFANSGLTVKIMNGTAIIDLCCMSMCDYIMGPPSTFSAWAGYIGNKKLLWMNDHNHIYKVTEFKIVPKTFSGTLDFWELPK